MVPEQIRYYRKSEEEGAIVCLLCQHYCKLREGAKGICGVNMCEQGILKNLVYGHPVALHVDPVEKKPLYHFLPGTETLSFGTVGCNFKCPFCQNWEISQKRKIHTQREVSPGQMVGLALEQGVSSIAYTYNEPTIFYPYARDIGVLAKAEGLKNIFVSNGFESPEVVREMPYWLDAANIDLKSWDDTYYRKVLKGGLEGVKETLKRMVGEGIWVEITTLVIPGDNDGEAALGEMAAFIADTLGKHIPWHLNAFHPDYKMPEHQATKPETLFRARKIAREAGLHYVYLGNIPIEESTCCPDCGTLLIERRGYSIAVELVESGKCPKCKREIEGVW